MDADTHLLELAAYLHLNPVRAGMAEMPEDYPWSSHRAYLGFESVSWLSSEYVLEQFSSDLEQARREFAEFVAGRISEGHREEFYGKGSIDNRVIGEDRFVENVLLQSDSLPERKPSLEEVLAVVSGIYELQERDLSSSSQKRRISEARSLAAWAVHELTDGTFKDLAERLGRDISTMSAAKKRFEERFKQDSGLREKAELLKKELKLSIFQA